MVLVIAALNLQPTSTAFTLIELLVVVAIMGVLVGLLFPVLASARSSADVAGCAANLRELAHANVAFAADHDQRYVPGAANFMQNRHRWHGSRDGGGEPFNHREGPLTPYLGKEGSIQQCPAYSPDGRGFEAGNGGYGYNNEYVGRDNPTDFDNPDALGARVDAFRDAAGTLMFADAAIAQPDGTQVIAAEYSFIEPPLWTWDGPSTPSIYSRWWSATGSICTSGRIGPIICTLWKI